ncbi:hypothetical protein MKX01_001280, partial [Papaver californicum]
MEVSITEDEVVPLLRETDTNGVQGVVNYKGEKVINRSKYGGWKSASFIIGVEIAERFAYYGIACNLITYLIGLLHQSTVVSAENRASGFCSMLPLLGAFVADSVLGRFRTIIISSLLYVLGLGLLTLSATLPSLRPPDCKTTQERSTLCASPAALQITFFFSSLYLVAIAQGGHKPCVQAFGADQFDERPPQECKSKSSFFNWWYFGLCGGTAISLLVVTYIQENLSWALGFGIPCISMAVALIVFLLGTKSIAIFLLHPQRIGELTPSVDCMKEEEESENTSVRVGAHQFKNKGCLAIGSIWATCLIYAVVFAQSSTFFTKQGSTMDRSIGPSFQIPAATLQAVISISIVILIPIYDRVLVPIARALTGKPSGITMLQRIGSGLFLSIISMVLAAIVEKKRLQTALNFGLIDNPKATIPMSVWWLAPQYFLFGLSDVFTMIGLQEFFYDQ